MVGLDELLKIAGAPNDARTRSRLDLNLQRARGHCRQSKDEKQTPTALFKQLDKSLTRTLILLQQLVEQPAWRDVCFRQFTSGDGMAVAVSPKELFDGKLALPRTPAPPRKGLPMLEANGTAIAINLRAVLVDIQREIVRRALKPRRGQPVKVDKSICVFYAKSFFDHHSRHKAARTQKANLPSSANLFTAPSAAPRHSPGRLLGTFERS